MSDVVFRGSGWTLNGVDISGGFTFSPGPAYDSGPWAGIRNCNEHMRYGRGGPDAAPAPAPRGGYAAPDAQP